MPHCLLLCMLCMCFVALYALPCPHSFRTTDPPVATHTHPNTHSHTTQGKPLVPDFFGSAERNSYYRGLYGRVDPDGHFPTSITDPRPNGKVGVSQSSDSSSSILLVVVGLYVAVVIQLSHISSGPTLVPD